jgi:hypothetical protein
MFSFVFEEDQYEEGLNLLLQRIIYAAGEVTDYVVHFPSGLSFNKGDKFVVVEPHGVDLKEFSMRFTPCLAFNYKT